MVARKRKRNFRKAFNRTVFAVVLAAVFLFHGIYAGRNASETVYAKDGNGDIVVIIDPGHGGYDGGAVSVYQDKESDLNWNIAKYMKAELETYAGVKVYITRANNEWNTNTGRAQFGRTLGADAVISIHNNSSGNSEVSGFVAYGSVAADYAEVTRNLCLNMARYAQAAGLNLYNDGYLTRSGSDPGQDYYTVIDEGVKAGIPTIIAEHCFLSNASNAAFINDAANQRRVGVADATAVAEFYGLSKRTISDGQSISLDRSYSAYFVPGSQREGAVSFSTSDENVAHVRADGLITAVNAGTAVITYTYQDGTSGSCTFTTKEVRQVGVAGGINPTVYHSAEAVAALDKSKIIVKAIYSDGTCRQMTSGYTVGDIDPNIAGRQFISVWHNGFNGSFSIYMDPQKEAGSYSDYLYQIRGDFSDSFTFPELVSIEGVSGSPYTSNGYVTTITPEENSAQTPPQPTQSEGQTQSQPAESEEQTPSQPTENEEQTPSQPAENQGGTQDRGEEPAQSEREQQTGSAAKTEEEDIDASGTVSGNSEPAGGDAAGKPAGTTEENGARDRSSSGRKKDSSIDGFLIVLVLIILLLLVFIVLASMAIVRNNRYNRDIEQRAHAAAHTAEQEPKRKKRR